MKKSTLMTIGLCLSFTAVLQAAGDNPLDVTIKGEQKEKITIERVAPSPNVDIKDVIPFSRLGQTDYILSEELGYIDEEKQVSLMDVNSPKIYKPSMVNFPKPPFFVQVYPPESQPVIIDKSENAPPPKGQTEAWTFIVIDADNNLLKKIEGNRPPVDPIQWDGMKGDDFLLRTDGVYSSVLSIQETRGVTKTIVGDPISLPALRYNKGNKIIFEFSNRRTYLEGGTTFSPALQVLVDQTINELKKFDGAPFQLTIYSRDLDLAQKRAESWRALLEKNLLRHADSFQVKVTLPADRGDITQVALEITK